MKVPNLPLHPQFSKDVLVNIYSAYIDNFLNAKDAVRVAKEARPAFLKFLEVLWVAQGDGRDPHLGPALGGARAPTLGTTALAYGSVFALGLGWTGWGPVPGQSLLCMTFLTRVPIYLVSGFSKACVRTRRSRRYLTS